MFGVVESI